jgi:hypothetical protein
VEPVVPPDAMKDYNSKEREQEDDPGSATGSTKNFYETVHSDLTPELSRAAKRHRLERIVRPHGWHTALIESTVSPDVPT